MQVHDSRPPFAGLANLTEEALASLPTPCYLLDEAQLRRNGEILLGVQQRTGCKILLAQKAFSNFDLYPVLAPYLAGTEASGLYESRLGREELPEKENHVFCAAYRAESAFVIPCASIASARSLHPNHMPAPGHMSMRACGLTIGAAVAAA